MGSEFTQQMGDMAGFSTGRWLENKPELQMTMAAQ